MAEKKLLTVAGMEKILKDAGADRVGESAKEALKHVLEELALEISKKAVKYSEHAKRRTVFASDVKMAAKEV